MAIILKPLEDAVFSVRLIRLNKARLAGNGKPLAKAVTQCRRMSRAPAGQGNKPCSFLLCNLALGWLVRRFHASNSRASCLAEICIFKWFEYKHLLIIFFSSLMGFQSLYIYADAGADHKQLVGNWQGSWDDIWSAKFFISLDINQQYQIKYHWQEHPQGHFSKDKYTAKIINQNTLLAGKIFLILDLRDKNQALAVGIFNGQSRVAYLTRADKTKSSEKSKSSDKSKS